MSLQFSDAVAHAMLDAIETAIGASPTMEIRTGAPPASCAAADSGTVLATLTLPADFFENAGATTARVKGLLGVWEDLLADAGGVAGHFRIKQGATCHIQGLVTQGGADLSVTNTNLAVDQPFSVNQFDIAAGNA